MVDWVERIGKMVVYNNDEGWKREAAVYSV